MLGIVSCSGGMATLAASNVAGILTGKPVLPQGSNVLPFVDVSVPHSCINACSNQLRCHSFDPEYGTCHVVVMKIYHLPLHSTWHLELAQMPLGSPELEATPSIVNASELGLKMK